MGVKIKYLTVGKWKENSLLIEGEQDAWLVDPGDEFERLDETFGSKKLKGIINTHAHFDHIGAVEKFQSKYNIPFYIHGKDKQLVRQGNLYRKLAGDNTIFKTPVIDGFLEDGNYMLDGAPITVHYTPGHTHGSVCFEIENNLISGDLIFRNNIGRTDLPGGNNELLSKSIHFVLENFIGYNIYPGHGDSFLLDNETRNHLKIFL